MKNLQNDWNMAKELALRVKARGGRVFLVGGCVRDGLMGREIKDIDVEVHGVSAPVLEEILDSLGERMAIGESFGIYAIKGCGLDIAMPRKEQLRGRGHKDFDVFTDPDLGEKEAARRRDFTVNAMMRDVLTGELCDPFKGQRDLKRRILRHVDDRTFPEDPLRVLRAAQFAARFEFHVAKETVELCRRMSLDALSKERVEGELKKALLQSAHPSIFFRVLRDMEQLGFWFPEIEALIGVPQNPRFHTEGDVWNHTMLVLDAAAKYREHTDNPFGFMLSALTHDLGKVTATEYETGKFHAYGHETAGLPMAEAFLRRITNENDLVDYVLNLTQLHMKPTTIVASGASLKTSNRMFDESIDPEGLIYLSMADGQGTRSPYPFVSAEENLRARLEIYQQTMAQPYVMGRDLIEAGLKPGPDFSEFLNLAHKLRLAGVPKDEALKQVLAEARKSRRKKGNG